MSTLQTFHVVYQQIYQKHNLTADYQNKALYYYKTYNILNSIIQFQAVN